MGYSRTECDTPRSSRRSARPAIPTPMLDALIAAGTDIVRLNFSHGTHESHGATFARVRAAAARAGREVAILQDLGGPKIRTGPLEGRPAARAQGGRRACGSRPATSSAAPGRVSTTVRRPGARRAARRSAAARRRHDRAARRRHRRHRDSDDRRRRRRARRAQGHQRAGRPAAGVGDHAEGRRRSEVRPVARRRHGRGQLRADARPTSGRRAS